MLTKMHWQHEYDTIYRERDMNKMTWNWWSEPSTQKYKHKKMKCIPNERRETEEKIKHQGNCNQNCVESN